VPDDGGGEGVVIGVRLEDNQPGERGREGNPQRSEQGADGGGFPQFAAAQPEDEQRENRHSREQPENMDEAHARDDGRFARHRLNHGEQAGILAGREKIRGRRVERGAKRPPPHGVEDAQEAVGEVSRHRADLRGEDEKGGEDADRAGQPGQQQAAGETRQSPFVLEGVIDEGGGNHAHGREQEVVSAEETFEEDQPADGQVKAEFCPVQWGLAGCPFDFAQGRLPAPR